MTPWLFICRFYIHLAHPDSHARVYLSGGGASPARCDPSCRASLRAAALSSERRCAPLPSLSCAAAAEEADDGDEPEDADADAGSGRLPPVVVAVDMGTDEVLLFKKRNRMIQFGFGRRMGRSISQ